MAKDTEEQKIFDPRHIGWALFFVFGFIASVIWIASAWTTGHLQGALIGTASVFTALCVATLLGLGVTYDEF